MKLLSMFFGRGKAGHPPRDPQLNSMVPELPADSRPPRLIILWLKFTLHRCSWSGCWRKGCPCFLPLEDEPNDYACWEHAHSLGYCRCCGQFWGGIGSFEFRQNGLCDHCDYEMRADSGEFDSDEYEDF